MSQAIGIDDLDVATTTHVVSLDDLAETQGIDPAKYHIGLGQDEFSIPAPDEDVVTLAATAAQRLLERHDASQIRQVMFATETGVDQSKSAGVFVHGLLGLPSTVRTIELKQACYSGTAALQLATDHVARFPEDKVLVIASDVARYALDTAGEPTQGAGAVAMLVSANPRLVELEPGGGYFTGDINDFWRPNDSSTPYVEGQLSLQAYLQATLGAWDDYVARHTQGDLTGDQAGELAQSIHRFLHHQPFTKMARKAHKALAEHVGVDLSDDLIEESMTFNRALGNTYTASMYFGLAAQLFYNKDLAGKRLGFFSYGSGAVSEFFTGIVQPGYELNLRLPEDLKARTRLSIADYRDLHNSHHMESENFTTPRVTTGPFRFAGVTDRIRQYEKVSA